MSTSLHRRIVIKLGTQVVMDDQGHLALARVTQLIEEITRARKLGHEIILISSGAVGLGRTELGSRALGRASGQRDASVVLAEKQACAAVGQSLLMETYRRLFAHYHASDKSNSETLKVAQLLVTAQDFSDRVHYLNLRRTLEMILKLGAIPVINENDPVSISEILGSEQSHAFGDNDALSALVASKMGAELLILLTNVDAVYTDNPKANPDAQRIALIENWDQLSKISLKGISSDGRGGMSSKLEAARLASKAGVRVVIATGFSAGVITNVIGKGLACGFGTWIEPAQKRLNQRALWIGGASGYQGHCIVNAGAAIALRERNASLLVAGILSLSGEFEPHDVIQIRDERNRELGRGLSRWSAHELKQVAGLSKTELEVRGFPKRSIVIHRDDFVLAETALLPEESKRS